jgi:hypothetical protein
MERSDILERMWAGKEEKRKAGKFSQSAVCLPCGVGYSETTGWFYTPDAEKVRTAFRLFLAGETSYRALGAKVGIEPFNLRNLLRNPIFTGWRVIDKRRDPSPAARRVKQNGRQGDRPKIPRKQEDVIRVKVIEEGLVSEADFEAVQKLVQVKRDRHWRTKPGHIHKYTYNGFLVCAVCDRIVYTRLARDDYYVCKGNLLEDKCLTRYMRRDRVELELDVLFGRRLTDRGFLDELVAESDRRSAAGLDAGKLERLKNQIVRLEAKRRRIVESFLDGLFDRTERDNRLAALDREISTSQARLAQALPSQGPSTDQLLGIFQPFREWEFLGRDQKRRVLERLAPEIRIANYRLHGLSLTLQGCSIEENRKGTDSSRPRA